MNKPPSIRHFHSLVFGALLLAGAASAQQKADFKNHPFFNRLVGEWTSEGEEKGKGTTVKFKQEWKGQVPGDNTFTIEGTREIAGLATHYKWTFKRTDSGPIEASLQPDIKKPPSMRYEVKVADDGSRMEMTALLPSKVKVAIVESFKDGGHDVLEVTVTTSDASGTRVYSSTAVSRRK